MKLGELLNTKDFKHRIAVTIEQNDTVAAAIQKLVEHDRGSIAVDNDKGELVGIITERDIVRKRFAGIDNTSSQVKIKDVMSQQVIIGTPEDDLDFAIRTMKEKRIRHIPIVANQKVLGMISMRDLLGVQLEECKVEVSYLSAVHKATKVINSALRIEDVLSAIARVVVEETSAKGCSIMLLDIDKKYLEHKHTYGLSDEYLRKDVIMADRILEDTMKGESIIAIPDVTKDTRILYPAETLKEGIASMLCVPINLKGTLAGIMRTYFSAKQEFGPDIIKLLMAIADLSAIAIENAKMYDSLKKAHDVCLTELGYWQP